MAGIIFIMVRYCLACEAHSVEASFLNQYIIAGVRIQ